MKLNFFITIIIIIIRIIYKCIYNFSLLFV
jgi:hypothetical protein